MIPENIHFLRIAQKRRFFGFVSAVVLVVGVVCGCATAKSTGEKETTIHIVRRGETVWDIAKQYCPDGTDVRRFAFEIAQDNGLNDYIIRAGERLVIHE